MKRIMYCLIFLLTFQGLALAFTPEYLIRIQRNSDFDLNILLENNIHVVMEVQNFLLAEGDDQSLRWLQEERYITKILDYTPRKWEYYLVGLRPDLLIMTFQDKGTIIHGEENLILFRAKPEFEYENFFEAQVFVTRVPHEKLKVGVRQPDRKPPGTRDVQPLVLKMVNSVDTSDIATYWTDLADNPPEATRYSPSQGCQDASDYCYNVFLNLGLQAQYQDYHATYAPNAIGVHTGAITPDNVYIVLGHLDDLPSTGVAPGADDNASGSVHALMSAHILSCYAFKNTIKFMVVTGEEQGLHGSSAYSDAAYAAGENILGVINMDMPGWAGDGTPDPEDLDLNYNSASQWLGDLYAQCATDYSTGLVVDAFLCPTLTASDHYSFWQNGYHAICGITDNEGYCSHVGHYPYYHTSDDTITNCGEPAFFYATVKTTIATLGELGEPFKIAFNRSTYSCSSIITIIVGDRDLNTNASTQQTVNVEIWSTTETTPETVTLTEDGVDSMIFKGTIPVTLDPPTGGDGYLSLTDGDTITGQYIDALDCDGSTSVTYNTTATADFTDCVAPTISNVQVVDRTDTTARVIWSTDEDANSRVTYGLATPPGINQDDLGTYVTSHSVILSGLQPCTTYYFSVTSTDLADNTTLDDNGGAYYTFDTLGRQYLFGPDDVESGPGSWSVTGSGGSDWHIDECRSSSVTHAWKAGANDYPTCSANYNNSVSTELVSTSIDLGASGHGYFFRFDEWYNTESGYDYCYVQISTNGGSSWLDLTTAYAGSSGGWISSSYDLAAYSSSVQFRFRFTSDGGTTAEGWYVDDIDVSRPQACGCELAHDSNSYTDVCNGTGSGSGDGFIDSGEDVALQVTLKNIGSLTATNVTATLSTTTPDITITGDSATYPDIPSMGTAVSQSPHFTFRVGTSVACGTTINFDLQMDSTQGSWSDAFSLTVGEILSGNGTALDENFSGGIPGTWTIVDGGSGGGAAATWTTANPGSRSASAPIADPFAIVDSDNAGSSATQDEQLIAPTLDLSTATSVTLEFDQYFNYISGYGDEYGDVDVQSSLTSGWVNVFRNHGADSPNPDHQTIDITAQAAGASNVQIRFYYYGGAYDYWWMVDNVVVNYEAPGGCNMNPCTPSSTGPRPVPDGASTTSPVLATKATGNQIDVVWDEQCTTQNTNIIYGYLTNLSGYTLLGSVCGVDDVSNPYPWSIADTNIWFVLVDDDDVNSESSWGQCTAGERNSTNPSNQCGCTVKDTSGTCP